MKKLVLVFLILFSTNAASGDGRYLLENCREAQKLWNGALGDKSKGMYCIGMLNGLVAAMVITANSTDSQTAKLIGVCLSDGSGRFIPTGEAINSVVKFLTDNPGRLDEPDFALAMKSLQAEYPCK
ncbi:hypothetical protein V9R55_003567 [Vibrio cholerae]